MEWLRKKMEDACWNSQLVYHFGLEILQTENNI